MRILHTPNSPRRPNRQGGPRYTFTFAAAPGVTYYCRIDKGPFKPCSSPMVYRHPAKGRHAFRVKAVGATGLESSPKTVRFTARGSL